MTKENTVTDARLEEAYTIAATVVRLYGEKYLPVFKRLHEERLLRKANSDLKEIALQIAQNKAP